MSNNTFNTSIKKSCTKNTIIEWKKSFFLLHRDCIRIIRHYGWLKCYFFPSIVRNLSLTTIDWKWGYRFFFIDVQRIIIILPSRHKKRNRKIYWKWQQQIFNTVTFADKQSKNWPGNNEGKKYNNKKNIIDFK